MDRDFSRRNGSCRRYAHDTESVQKVVECRSIRHSINPVKTLTVTYDVRTRRSPAISSDDNSAIEGNGHDRGLDDVGKSRR
jgi:hypothetical protein